MNDLYEAITQFVPLYETFKEQIDILNTWALSGKVRNASKKVV